jgi:hypothetical protein
VIRLALPDLFDDRLAKLTEHAAHVDMVISALPQYDLRIAPVTQWLQRQAVRVLEAVDRAVHACQYRRLCASMGYLIQYSALHTTVWTAFAAGRDHPPMCGRYVAPNGAGL